MTMQLQIISINALIISLLIDVRRSSNQKSFNVKFHSIQSFHNIITTIRTFNLSENYNSQTKNSPINSFDLDDLDGAVLLQSKKCSNIEMQEKIQCFEDLPQDRYDVLHNSSVVIKCVVRNQHGKVQWRAQNVVLGYDRSVPGMERLSIIGDASKGEHNLQITNIQPRDSGEYECQVQPVFKHPLLRKKTQVFVQQLPTKPEILYKKRKLIDHTLIITPNQMYDSKLILECQTSDAISHVQFIWYWNRQVVSETNQPEVVITSLSNNRSQIELRIDQLNSNDKIQCRVENKASQMIRKIMKTYSELSVTITVLFYSFPGQPKILNSSFFLSNQFEETEKLTIVCQVSPIGSPVPEIKWFWYFHKISLLQYDHLNFNSHHANSVEIKSHRITIDSFKDDLTTTVFGLRLSKFHHAANITCVVRQMLLKSNHFTSVRIFVKHPPSVLKIYLSNVTTNVNHLTWEQYIAIFDSLNSNTTIDLVDGAAYRFVCSTNLHYTTININWSLTLKDNRKEQYNLENSRQSEIIVGDFFKQTNSYLEFKANKEIINMDLVCTAWPVDSVILSVSVQIKLFFPPERPIVTGYTHAESVNEYETINLLCTTRSGYPVPDLVWYKENVTLSNAEPVVTNEDKISSMLSFKVSREDNGKLINCAARNIATPNFGISSHFVVIRTIFPARYVKIRTDPSHQKQIVENSIIFLTCETDSSNPASDIQWWLIRCSFADSRRLMKRQVPCSKNKLKEVHRDIASGSYNGWKTISKLRYLVKWEDNENFIECESKLPNSDQMTSSLHYDRLRVNVIFAPHFSNQFHNGTTFQIQENLKLVINLKAYGNPELIRYSWLLDNRPLEQDADIHYLNHILTINKVSRSHSRNYSLIATNDVGKNEIRFSIDITYPPTISGENVTQVHVKFNENEIIKCEVSSNPYSTKYLKWKVSYPFDILSPLTVTQEWHSIYEHKCSEIQDRTLKQFNETRLRSVTINCSTPRQFFTVSNFHLSNSSLFHNAVLQCFYDNKISSPVMKNFIFYIDSMPRYQVVRQFAFQGVQNSEAAIFTCIFKGYPIKTVEWHNCTSVDHNYMDYNYMDPINNRSLYHSISNLTLLSESTDIYQIHPNLYRAENKIWHHDWRMLNKICCQAVNDFGSDIGMITVLFKSKPHSPENIKLFEVSSTFIIIKWDQAFDGGVDQTFRIKVHRKDKSDETSQFDLSGTRYRNSLSYNISGLLCNVCYMITVGAFNKLFADVSVADAIEACTISESNSPFNNRLGANTKPNITNKIPNIPKIHFESIQKSTSFIVTVAGCVFGFIIFIINVLTFVICYKKKRERVRKRRQNKEIQSTDERQTENLSKYDSSLLENHLYDESMLATSDSCYITDHRDKEEEIPMLMYQKPICPLHFVSNDQFSNPLIIQDHYLQPAMGCSQSSNKNESSCYGCTSIEFPLNSMILSNQYLQFPLLESTYNSLLRSTCDYSTSSDINHPQMLETRVTGEKSQIDPQSYNIEADLSNTLSKIPLSLQTIHLNTNLSPIKQTGDSYQNIFRKPTKAGEKQSHQSPVVL